MVFAAWDPVEETHVDELVRLTAETRNLQPEDLERYGSVIKEALSGFSSAHGKFQWARSQTYLALGIALAAAAAEQVDAAPMEGFDAVELDALLGLEKRNLRSVVLMALGYRDTENDRMAGQPKVRWPREKLVHQPALCAGDPHPLEGGITDPAD